MDNKKKGSRANETRFKIGDLMDNKTLTDLSKHLPKYNASEKVQKLSKKEANAL